MKAGGGEDRKSTRLNSSHRCISYAVFCLNKTWRVYVIQAAVGGFTGANIIKSARSAARPGAAINDGSTLQPPQRAAAERCFFFFGGGPPGNCPLSPTAPLPF